MLPTFLAFLAIIAIGLIYWMSRRQEERGGFRDWVKNPDYREAVEEAMDEEDRQFAQLTVPADMPTKDIRALVERLLEVETDRFTIRRLQLLGDRAVPALLNALKDPRYHRGKETDKWHERIPLEKTLELLEPFGPPELVPLLAPWIKHQDHGFRKIIALALGNIGSNACIEPLTAALADEDDYVRDYAMMGIQRGLKVGHCMPRFLDAMFERIVLLLDRDDSTASGTAPATLLQIDRAKAIPLLLGERYCTAANGELHYILKAVNEARIPVPRETLQRLMQELEPKAKDYPFDYSYGEALIALAYSGDSSTDKTLREALQSGNKRVSEDAARALCIVQGVPNPMGFVGGRLQEIGFERLTEQQQAAYAAWILAGEVRNGGFAQYFVNPSGNYSRQALAGLELIGAKQAQAIVTQAMHQFGPDGPATERDVRARQLAALSAKQDAELDRLNTEFYKDQDRLDIKLLLFALDNKDHFRQSPAGPQGK